MINCDFSLLGEREGPTREFPSPERDALQVSVHHRSFNFSLKTGNNFSIFHPGACRPRRHRGSPSQPHRPRRRSSPSRTTTIRTRATPTTPSTTTTCPSTRTTVRNYSLLKILNASCFSEKIKNWFSEIEVQ